MCGECQSDEGCHLEAEQRLQDKYLGYGDQEAMALLGD
jgi:positive regulator of sigma E activity